MNVPEQDLLPQKKTASNYDDFMLENNNKCPKKSPAALLYSSLKRLLPLTSDCDIWAINR